MWRRRRQKVGGGGGAAAGAGAGGWRRLRARAAKRARSRGRRAAQARATGARTSPGEGRAVRPVCAPPLPAARGRARAPHSPPLPAPPGSPLFASLPGSRHASGRGVDRRAHARSVAHAHPGLRGLQPLSSPGVSSLGPRGVQAERCAGRLRFSVHPRWLTRRCAVDPKCYRQPESPKMWPSR